ncbi:MAG: septum formation initiator family protein [Deltaproteobacteria bacterium]|nr:septum formation initiator family protein [Deltaproteobacteria bacterium]
MKLWIMIIGISLVAGGVILYLSLYNSDNGIERLNRLRAEYDSLLTENRKLREENHNLRLQIELLKNDDRYIEKVARERNMIKEGDIVFRVKQ